MQSAPQIEGRIDGGEGYIRGRFTSAAGRRSLADASCRRAARVDDVSGRTVRRAIAWKRVDPRRRGGLACRARPDRRLHAPLLQPGGDQRPRLGRGEPPPAARAHGVFRSRVDPAWHRGTDPHHRHGRGLERAHFRAHQGGAGGGQSGQGCGGRRLRPRVPDHPRYAHRLADCRRVPVSVRHRADSRIRHDADVRPARQRVHGRLRVPHDFRGGPRRAAAGRACASRRSRGSFERRTWTSTGGAGTR